ncbi:MAG: beta-ketoacyl-[acyl-carrier-protein] synthase family protein [Puniceicoccaceae bacterium]
MDSVVITGLGFITSIGNDRREVVSSLRSMKNGIETYLPFSDSKIPVKVMGTIKGFETSGTDQEDWTFPDRYRINRSFLRSLSPHALYGYCAVVQALEEAGLSLDAISDERTGLYTASAGSTSFLVHHLNYLNEFGAERSQPKAIVASIAGTLNFNLASQFRIKGSTCGFVSACASSAHALGLAFEEIIAGRQERMLVVGAEDGNRDCILPFASMRALSTNPDPETASRPFDRQRDGFVGTGGAVCLILENEETARARGGSILARMLGYGQASDGYSAVLPEAEGDGLRRAMEQALRRADLSVSDVDYINAHAPSTPLGDLAEIRALRRVFGERHSPAISSTKSQTGHALSMASALEAGLSILAMNAGMIPGTAHLEEPDEEAVGLDLVTQPREGAIETFLSNSSGFGGANVCLAFGKP